MPASATVGVTPSVSPVVVSHDSGVTRLPADLSAITVVPFEGPSLRTTVVPDAPTTPVVAEFAIASAAKTLLDSHERGSGTLLEAVSNALSSGVVVDTHRGEDPPPSGDSEDEVTGQASGVVGGQTTTSPRFSTFLPGFAHAFASQTSSSTVKRGK